MTSSAPVRLGALVPLTPPGWVDAGADLLAGLELGVEHVNAAGGIDGHPLVLVVRDTAADPQRAAAAVSELAELGVVALAGEYHSVAARAAAVRADAVGLPFLCSSAVLDALTDHPTDWVARLCPAQSHGWRIYAEFLLSLGHTRIAVATQPSRYWAAGTRILRESCAQRGAALVDLDMSVVAPAAVGEAVLAHDVTALLLLTGVPEPAAAIVRAIRRDARLIDVLIGAPAGQPELAVWAAALGPDGCGIPFLRYSTDAPGELGTAVRSALREKRGRGHSFVAFEGYDTIVVLADVLRTHGTDRSRIAGSWSAVAVDGTRGPIRFSRAEGDRVWQWKWAPVEVVERDPDAADRFRVRRHVDSD